VLLIYPKLVNGEFNEEASCNGVLVGFLFFVCALLAFVPERGLFFNRFCRKSYSLVVNVGELGVTRLSVVGYFGFF